MVAADPERIRLWDSVWSWGRSRCEVCSKDLGRVNSFEWLARGFFVEVCKAAADEGREI